MEARLPPWAGSLRQWLTIMLSRLATYAKS
jgi:hypothetical protein